MAIQWSREVAKERSLSGRYQDNYAYTRAFLVRTDDPIESLADISNEPGIAYMDAHPQDVSVHMLEFDVKPVDDSGLVYLVSFKYGPAPPNNSDDGGGEDPQFVAGLMKQAIWTASSSVTSGPIDKDRDWNAITNSAGDPLEDVTAEQAEFKLQVTLYSLDHATWMNYARQYTNSVNDAEWNGGVAKTWKCQGCSARMNTETHLGQALSVWEITWDFAYRAGGWQLQLLDVGFNQLVNEDGTPSSAGTKKASFKGQDNKGSKSPVGLDGMGMFVTPPTKPAILQINVYQEKDFSIFGEVYTP
jgi:hypothetical protein